MIVLNTAPETCRVRVALRSEAELVCWSVRMSGYFCEITANAPDRNGRIGRYGFSGSAPDSEITGACGRHGVSFRLLGR